MKALIQGQKGERRSADALRQPLKKAGGRNVATPKRKRTLMHTHDSGDSGGSNARGLFLSASTPLGPQVGIGTGLGGRRPQELCGTNSRLADVPLALGR